MPDVAVAQAALLGRALVVAFQYLWVAKKIGGVAGMNSLVVLMVIQVFAITFAHCLVAPGSSFHYNRLCRQYIQIITYSVCMRLFGKPGKTLTPHCCEKRVKGVPTFLTQPGKPLQSFCKAKCFAATFSEGHSRDCCAKKNLILYL